MEVSVKCVFQLLQIYLIFSMIIDNSMSFTIRRQSRKMVGFPLKIRVENFFGKYGDNFIHNMNHVPVGNAVGAIKDKLLELDEEISDGILQIFRIFREMERVIWGG